jgi:hypothetical protein
MFSLFFYSYTILSDSLSLSLSLRLQRFNRQFTARFNRILEQYNPMRFQVLTAASMTMIAFWDIVPCSLDSPPWRWRQYAPLKRLSTTTRLHDVIFQKSVIFNAVLYRFSTQAILCSWVACPLQATADQSGRAVQVSGIDPADFGVVCSISLYYALI